MTETSTQQGQQATTEDRGKRATRTGTVVSDRGDKTIKVVFAFTKKHRKYHKFIRRSTTLHVHDEKNEAKVGDIVEVMSCRRISKTKAWRLTKVVSSL
ncbi:MAG: 30S ribosomal protein S17 [Planctomycetota bacterium]|jgi:small subunit ribosomal protein S17